MRYIFSNIYRSMSLKKVLHLGPFGCSKAQTFFADDYVQQKLYLGGLFAQGKMQKSQLSFRFVQ